MAKGYSDNLLMIGILAICVGLLNHSETQDQKIKEIQTELEENKRRERPGRLPLNSRTESSSGTVSAIIKKSTDRRSKRTKRS